MRKIGGHVSVAGGLPNAVANTLNIEGTCLQIFAGSPRSWARFPYDPKQVKSFRTLVESHDLDPVFIHALYLINLASDNEELLEKSTASLIADLDNGEKIGSAGVVVHIGSHQGRGFDSVSQQLIEVIELILSRTSNTPLLLENDAGQNGKIGALNEINFLIDKIRDPRLQVCLDTAHLWGAGYDISTAAGVGTVLADFHRRIGIEAEYVAIDPYREQLDLFRARLDETGRRYVTLARSPLETFDAPAGSFDLVVASHSLYYVPDVADAARRIRTLGKEALVVHHGPRGIDEVHRAFPALVRRQGFVVSTYDDVLPHFPGATLRSFTGTVDVAPCHDPASEDGLDLVSFFLERDARALPPEARAKIAAWFRARFPAGTMAHDVGVIS